MSNNRPRRSSSGNNNRGNQGERTNQRTGSNAPKTQNNQPRRSSTSGHTYSSTASEQSTSSSTNSSQPPSGAATPRTYAGALFAASQPAPPTPHARQPAPNSSQPPSGATTTRSYAGSGSGAAQRAQPTPQGRQLPTNSSQPPSGATTPRGYAGALSGTAQPGPPTPQGRQLPTNSSQPPSGATTPRGYAGALSGTAQPGPPTPQGRQLATDSSRPPSGATTPRGYAAALSGAAQRATPTPPGRQHAETRGKGKAIASDSPAPSSSDSPRFDHKMMNPSNVMEKANQPSRATNLGDDDSLSWSHLGVSFVKTVAKNAYVGNRNNDADYNQQRKEISADLQKYTSYHRGRDAIFPARPPPIQRLELTSMKASPVTVVANHFSIEVPSRSKVSTSSGANSLPQFYLYSVKWLVETPSWPSSRNLPKDCKERWWSELIKPHIGDQDSPIYDGGSRMICNSYFRFSQREIKWEEEVQLGSDEKTVAFKFITIVDWEGCTDFLTKTGERNAFPTEAIKVLNMVMKQYCKRKDYIQSGGFYFDKEKGNLLNRQDNNNNSLLFIGRPGYFQSVRALEGGLTLNVDIMSTAFYKPGIPLVNLWKLMLSGPHLSEASKRSFRNWTYRGKCSEEQVGIINEYWKNLQILSTHRNRLPATDDPGTKEFTIFKLELEPAGEKIVEELYTNDLHLSRANLCTFMKKRYYVTEDDELTRSMPAIKVSKTKEHYLPWGCCQTSNASRYAGKLEDYRILQSLERDPEQRCNDVKSWMLERYPGQDNPQDGMTAVEDSFKIVVEPQMMKIEAIQLDRPVIAAWGGKELTWYTRGSPNFDFKYPQKYISPGTALPLGILRFDGIDNQWMEDILGALQHQAGTLGVLWQNHFPVMETVPRDDGTDNIARLDLVEKHVLKLLNQSTTKLNLILCFMPRKMTPEYGAVKVQCDIKHGVPVQVLIPKRNKTNLPKLAQNLLLKINVKCGGINFLPKGLKTISFVQEKTKTMLIGADVTHPRGMHSVAAVVATTDSKFGNYATRIKPQDSGVEFIRDLKDMVKDLLQVYYSNEGCWPRHILFFRDGVSESNYLDVLRTEGVRILDAAEEVANAGTSTSGATNAERPKLAIIVAVKRHHTRFFINKIQERTNTVSNITEGIVVDSGVTHPRDYDFFLCSQAPLKGTSRATHYYVLLDQINMSRAELYQLIYYLCHSYQRCTKSVSLVTPVYYAHLAAFRAKLYMETLIIERRGVSLQNNIQLDASDTLKDHLWFL